MRFMRLLFCFFAAIATVIAVARPARADQVVVLPFTSAGGTTGAELEQARKATRDAAVSNRHKLATDAQLALAEKAMPRGGATSSVDFRAAGRASSSDWVITGRVEHGATIRLELEVIYVDTGRLETLA